MVKANVDRILEVLKDKKSASLGELSKKTGIAKTDLEKSAEYLEQDGVVKLERKFPNTYVKLIKDTQPTKKKGEIPPPPQINQQSQKMPAAPQPQSIQPPKQETIPPAPNISQQESGLKSQASTQENIPPAPMNKGKKENLPPPPIPKKKPEWPGGKVDNPKWPGEENKQPMPQPPKNQSETSPVQKPRPPQSIKTEMPQPIQQPPSMSQQQNMPGSEASQSAKPVLPKSEKSSQEQFLLDNNDPKTKDFSPLMQQKEDKLTPEHKSPIEPGKPNFGMEAPEPMPRTRMPGPEAPLDYSEEHTPKKEYAFPDYTDSSLDKIDYLIEEANKKISMQQFDGLNVMYRKIYNLYQQSNDISPNERQLVGEKIKDLFERIKRLYMIEHVT